MLVAQFRRFRSSCASLHCCIAFRTLFHCLCTISRCGSLCLPCIGDLQLGFSLSHLLAYPYLLCFQQLLHCHDLDHPHDFLAVSTAGMMIELPTDVGRTTNPEVRSVKLLGSWDNFSKPYSMERDKRIGQGHWKGCHTFTDIMGDTSGDRNQWRTGGLKMGATYWYYVGASTLSLMS